MAGQKNTKQRMINSALELFHLQGVNATSVDQILENSGTGKSQFSHYFKNKDGLIQAVLSYLHLVIKENLAPTGYKLKTWKDLEQWFKKYLDFQKSVNFQKSCPIGTIGNDIFESQKQLRVELIKFLDWSHLELVGFFKDKQNKKELSSLADPQGLADLLMTVMQGGMLLTKIRRDPKHFENAAKQTLKYINSLRT